MVEATETFSGKSDDLDWFINNNETLLVGGKKDLVKNDKELQTFTETSCMLCHPDRAFHTLLNEIINEDSYKAVLPGIETVEQLIKRLIYNRPLVFSGELDYTKTINGKYWFNDYDPLLNNSGADNYDLKYQLVALGALMGCCSLTPIVNSGNKESRENFNLLREKKFFKNDQNYNTTSYVCGLVGSRFEKEKKMERAYITEEENPDNGFIYRKLREYFETRFNINKSKYKYNFEGKKKNLYRERIRFTFELFLHQCYSIFLKTGTPICPVFTGLGGGVWKDASGIAKEVIYEIFEDSILSILTDNLEAYKKAFPGIRLSGMSSYKDMNSFDDTDTECIPGISNVFNDKYTKQYNTLMNSGLEIFHNHYSGPEKGKHYGKFSFLNTDHLNKMLETRGWMDMEAKEAFLFAWDGNSFVGNEYWIKDYAGSMDPVIITACSLAQLCNPFINKGMLTRIEPPTTAHTREELVRGMGDDRLGMIKFGDNYKV